MYCETWESSVSGGANEKTIISIFPNSDVRPVKATQDGNHEHADVIVANHIF
jgi:hypothetical protein